MASKPPPCDEPDAVDAADAEKIRRLRTFWLDTMRLRSRHWAAHDFHVKPMEFACEVDVMDQMLSHVERLHSLYLYMSGGVVEVPNEFTIEMPGSLPSNADKPEK